MIETSFIILGATGDLSKRKLIPAIYKLIESKKIDKFSIIGAASSQNSVDKILEQSKNFIEKIDNNIWEKLRSNFYYQQLDFYNESGYLKLKNLIDQVEKKENLIGNKIFYLATMPEHFQIITKYLGEKEIVLKHDSLKECENCNHPWSRIVYEKPFGYDLEDAKKINKYISTLFHEKQIYRIDHYLCKDLVSNIALIRFTNKIFEPLWNHKNIESVQIILNENIGIENRGAFYDKYGALKDVVQNHMLQILALTAMEKPQKLDAKSIRDAKAKVLKKIKVKSLFLGQYEGYQQESKVNPNSKTETFAALKLLINNSRWKNVPFFLKTGKFLDKKEVSIHIKFKMVKCLLNQGCPTDSNYLTINIEPEEGFFLELNTKIPGYSSELTKAKMSFCHSCIAGVNTPASYEKLLYDIIEGDQSVFVRSDEIEYSWQIIDKIKKEKIKVYPYKKFSNGPESLKIWNKKNKIRWRA